LPGAAGGGDAQTAVDAAAIDKASLANSAKGIQDAGAARLPKARAGNSAVAVSQSAGRADSPPNTSTIPSVGSGDNAASTSVGSESATDGVATLQTAVALASSAAAGAAATAGSAVAAEAQANDSAVPVTAGAARPADRANRPLEPPAPVVVQASAVTAAKAATSADAAALANSVESEKHPHGASADALASPDTNGVAGAAGVGPNATAATDATPTPTLKIAAAVDTPEFGHGLADRVSWMVGNNLNGAKLQVNPSQLGPIEVRIAVQGSHAQVWLTSHSAVTRDALESSSQKLRDMLGAQGFGQVSVDISQRSFQERSPQAQPYDWTPSADSAASPASVASIAARSAHLSSSAVDAYA
jgi:flagellar hook-length control protein FliK